MIHFSKSSVPCCLWRSFLNRSSLILLACTWYCWPLTGQPTPYTTWSSIFAPARSMRYFYNQAAIRIKNTSTALQSSWHSWKFSAVPICCWSYIIENDSLFVDNHSALRKHILRICHPDCCLLRVRAIYESHAYKCGSQISGLLSPLERVLISQQ